MARPVVTALTLSLTGLLAAPAAAETKADLTAGLVGHWKLAGDARDHSGRGHHARNRGADLTAEGPSGKPNTAARLDGRGAFLEVSAGEALRLGTGDFSLSAWVWIDPADDDLPGDVLSHYDPAARRGFNLGVVTAHVTTNQANR